MELYSWGVAKEGREGLVWREVVLVRVLLVILFGIVLVILFGIVLVMLFGIVLVILFGIVVILLVILLGIVLLVILLVILLGIVLTSLPSSPLLISFPSSFSPLILLSSPPFPITTTSLSTSPPLSSSFSITTSISDVTCTSGEHAHASSTGVSCDRSEQSIVRSYSISHAFRCV